MSKQPPELPGMPDFPKYSEFDKDPRVQYLEETGKYVFTNPDDGIEYEYDEGLCAWFPMWNETLVEAQQSVYGDGGDVSEVKAGDVKDTNRSEPALPPGRKRKPKTNRQSGERTSTRVNTSVYVTGLPPDTTEDEVAEFFKKCGTLMPDLVTNKPKVKLYRDSEGKLKGDALVTYYKAPSVQLAIDILDDTPFRDVDPKKPDQQVWKVHVQVAEFKAKDTLDERRSAEGAEDQSQARKVRKLDPKLVKRKLEQMEKKLDWFEGPTQMAEKHQKVVILKHMFTPQELEEDVTLLIDLKEDVREECEKLGEVTNVKIYDKEDEGVISVKFRDKMSAAACVKVMNGRFFAGRQIEASLYDGRKKYRSTKKDEETEKQVEQRMENYAKWLESSKS